MLPQEKDSADALQGKVAESKGHIAGAQQHLHQAGNGKATIRSSLADVMQKAKSQLPQMPVTFSVKPPPGATDVHVVGSWNKWSQDHPLSPTHAEPDPYGDSGLPTFSCVLELPVGEYHFKFHYRVPGQEVGWMLSQEAEIGQDSDGHQNNVVKVDHSLFVTSAPQPAPEHAPSRTPSSMPVLADAAQSAGNQKETPVPPAVDYGTSHLAQAPEAVLAEEVVLPHVEGEWSLTHLAAALARAVPAVLFSALILYGLARGLLELLGIRLQAPSMPAPDLSENAPAVAAEHTEVVNPLLVGVMLGTCFQMSLLRLMTNPLTAVFGGG